MLGHFLYKDYFQALLTEVLLFATLFVLRDVSTLIIVDATQSVVLWLVVSESPGSLLEMQPFKSSQPIEFSGLWDIKVWEALG